MSVRSCCCCFSLTKRNHPLLLPPTHIHSYFNFLRENKIIIFLLLSLSFNNYRYRKSFIRETKDMTSTFQTAKIAYKWKSQIDFKALKTLNRSFYLIDTLRNTEYNITSVLLKIYIFIQLIFRFMNVTVTITKHWHRFSRPLRYLLAVFKINFGRPI